MCLQVILPEVKIWRGFEIASPRLQTTCRAHELCFRLRRSRNCHTHTLPSPTFFILPHFAFKMPIIDWIFSLFRRYSREKRLSSLELLPRELLLHIGNLLTTADIICLSLCSRTLNLFTRSFYGFKPPQDKSLTLLVLTRLTRDLPKMFCCHYCAKLHRITDVIHPARSMGFRHRCPDLGVWHRKCPQPSIRWLLSVHCMTTLYDFRHCHLVAVLQNYHSGGRYGINAESLAFTEVVDYPQQPRITTLLSVEGRVCTPAGAHKRPSLVLQIQQWVLVHDLKVFSDRGLDVVLSVLHNLFICNWLRIGHGSIQDKIRPENRQRNLCWKEAPLTEIMRCSHCGVEFSDRPPRLWGGWDSSDNY